MLWRIIAIATALITAAAVVFIVKRVDPLNKYRMFVLASAVCTLGGWTVITLRILATGRLRAAAAHVKAVLTGKSEMIEGRFIKTDERIWVKKAVTMCTVDVEGSSPIHIYDKKLKLFDFGTKKVWVVHGFITAYEAEDETD